jgi:hypothetical protein
MHTPCIHVFLMIFTVKPIIFLSVDKLVFLRERNTHELHASSVHHVNYLGTVISLIDRDIFISITELIPINLCRKIQFLKVHYPFFIYFEMTLLF